MNPQEQKPCIFSFLCPVPLNRPQNLWLLLESLPGSVHSESPALLQALEELCGTFLHRSCHLWLLLKIPENTFFSLSRALNPCRQGPLHTTGSNSLLNKIPHPYPPKIQLAICKIRGWGMAALSHPPPRSKSSPSLGALGLLRLPFHTWMPPEAKSMN